MEIPTPTLQDIEQAEAACNEAFDEYDTFLSDSTHRLEVLARLYPTQEKIPHGEN